MTLPTSAKQLGLAAAFVIVATVGYLKVYAWPRDERLHKIEQQRVSNTSFEAALADKARIRDGLKKIAGTTLSVQADEAVARFRTSLGMIAVGGGLGGVSVNTMQPEKVIN